MQKRYCVRIILALLVGLSYLLMSCGGGGGGNEKPVSLNLSINPTSLSAGQVNVVYSRTVTMTAKGGKKPYSYGCEASGVSGLTISISPSEKTSDSATCTISGIPTESGSYSVGFSVTDSSQSAAFADTISFSVKPPFPQREVKELFVLNPHANSISVFDASLSGDIKPLRTFGNMTGLSGPSGIAVDTTHNEIFVANQYNNSITVYSRSANGNTAPLRTFSLELGLNHLIIDNSNDEIFVGDYFYTGWKPSLAGFVTVYPRIAAGIVEPLRTIRSLTIGGMAVDTLNNEIFLAFGPYINVYARTANISDAPLRIIRTGDGSFDGGIAVDVLSNEIFVTDRDKHRISIYTRTADGEVPPSRMISGAASGVNFFGQIILL